MSEENKTPIWPMPMFYFKVKIGEMECSFQEVSGLNTETQIIDYRSSTSSAGTNFRLPNLTKYSNVTLKKGVFSNNDQFFRWYNSIKIDMVKKENVIIQLLDESGTAQMTWTLLNAWPIKISSTDLISNDNKEMAIESLELAHEGLTIANG